MNILILASVALLPMSSAELRVEPSPRILASLARMEAAILSSSAAPAKHVQTPAKPQRSTGRKIAGGVIGAAGGFVAGTYLGHILTPNKGDLPGWGIIIGAPLGAIIGANLGARFL